MITKTEIIILRTIDFSESSRICTVLSRKHGKIGLIAKGARKSKSKFAGMLQPGMILSVVYYYKDSREIQTLTEASFLNRFDTFVQDIEKMALSMSLLEFTSQLIHEGEVNEPVFEFIRNFLNWLDVQKEVNHRIFPYLQIRLAYLFGLELQIDKIREEAEIGYLNIEDGTVSEQAVSSDAIQLTGNQLRFIKFSSISKNVSILELNLNNLEIRSLIDYLDKYFRYHVEGLKPRRTDAIFDQILNN